MQSSTNHSHGCSGMIHCFRIKLLKSPVEISCILFTIYMYIYITFNIVQPYLKCVIITVLNREDFKKCTNQTNRYQKKKVKTLPSYELCVIGSLKESPDSFCKLSPNS